ncbi:hypothetical protein NUW58_g3060 [Xylaria curta]|uniref:Uncharacterized protein n=1 Tax=Xylaria curta TaxID=42375 RepID=A0ACC1PCQ9_9PEZI|nr:hypothetical protein NUW58_g3060 [Xylaria curta]
MASSTASAVIAPPQWKAALLGFATMFSVGTVYALSSLQNAIPRLFEVSQPWSYSLFAAACLGLTMGVGICASCIAAYGEYFVAIAGTALWGVAVVGVGYFLATIPSLLGVLGSLFVGGVGVGLTYLATIVLVGQAFPNQPLARSAIGPLGFSSGAGTWFAVWSHYQIGAADVEQLQRALGIGGGTFIFTAVVSYALAPSRAAGSSTALPPHSEKTPDRRFFLMLLFCNALPGMAAFGALFPITSFYVQENTTTTPDILPYLMIALALGGFFSSAISNLLGARSTFVMLFCVRSMLLITTSLSSTQSVATVTLLVMFFAHGAGFSIIPGLVKARQSKPAFFPYEYGTVLTAWGVAGIVGNAMNAAFVPLSGETATVSLILGLVTLTFGITLYLNPAFGSLAFS